MSTLRNIRMLTRYSAWANARLFDSLAALSDHEVTAQRSDGAGSMLKVLNHACVVDLIWQAHLLGKPHGFTSRNTDVLPGFPGLRDAQQRLDNWYVRYADDLTDDLHGQVVRFSFVDGGAGAMTRGDMLLHVVNHKTYHRGYVAQMLYQASLRPPTMDLPVFLRDVPLDIGSL
jgi:uncharacterized damage-inducible protein DinB